MGPHRNARNTDIVMRLNRNAHHTSVPGDVDKPSAQKMLCSLKLERFQTKNRTRFS